MNVRELIEVLQAMPELDLPVCIADWSEQYTPPLLLEQADINVVRNGKYIENDRIGHKGTFICLGEW